jgi:aminotransferase in exopolysaccharide biosynthesis
LHTPFFGGNEKKYLLECIDSTYVSSVGAFVNQFETDISNYTGARHGVATVNGTSALHAALIVCGVQENDEVLTQSLTFVATANAIKYCNAEPVFIDVDKDTMGLSPTALQSFLEEYSIMRNGRCYNKNTNKIIRACLPMHTFGFPCRIIEICEICAKFGIKVIEDAAEAIGSELNGQKIGTFGDVGVFSFNGNKVITAGGGGAIVTNNEKIAKESKHLTTTGKINHPYEFHHDRVAFNYRMPNINAALLCAQLEQLEQFLINKRKLAEQYKTFFDQLDEQERVKLRWEQKNTKANFWLISLEMKNKKARDYFLKETNEHEIMTRPIWQLMHKLPMFRDCFKDKQENAQYLEERIVNIPSSYRKNG